MFTLLFDWARNVFGDVLTYNPGEYLATCLATFTLFVVLNIMAYMERIDYDRKEKKRRDTIRRGQRLKGDC